MSVVTRFGWQDMRAIPRSVAGRLLWALVVLTAVAVASSAAPTPPGDSGEPQALPGEFLIAARDMDDPRFDHTVILMVQHDAGGAFGLIVNRPVEDEPLAKLLDDLGQKSEGAAG